MGRRLSLMAPLTRYLARHLDRLTRRLADLREQLREVVAHAIGQTVADAAREAVRSFLEDRTVRPATHSHGVDPPRPQGRPQTGSADRAWPSGRADDEDTADDSLYFREPCADEEVDEDATACSPTLDSSAWAQPRRWWGQAIAAACEAAAWYLTRLSGRCRGRAAVGAGLLSAVAVYAGGPGARVGLLVPALGAAGSALLTWSTS